MRTKRLLLSLSLLLAAGITFTFLTSLKNPSDLYKKGKISYQLLTGNLSEFDVQFLNSISKMNPGEKPIKKRDKSASAISMNWTEMGPDNLGGRTRAVLIDRNNENLLFAGCVTGGLWKSPTGGLSWYKVDGGDMFDNLCVSSICQTSNGTIYIGTGEYYAYTNNVVHGFRGQGMWQSTDHGTTWTHMTSTWNDNDNSKQIFYYVNKIASPTNIPTKIYVATIGGLMVSTDGGANWSNPITDANANMPCTDVQVSADGQVVVISLNNLVYVCNTGNDVFVDKTGTIPSGLGRLEFSIAPSNSNYIYCLAADASGALKNVYQSTNKGDTWTNLIPVVNSQFSPFGTFKLGIYENAIAVFPDNPDHILLGGENLFEWSSTTSWQQITNNLSIVFYPKYIHSGIHSIKFSANYSATTGKIIIGTDGGAFVSQYAGEYASQYWTQVNKKYNTTQFYSVAFSNNGEVIGGTRNHGTQYISRLGTDVQDAQPIIETNNGGHCEYSMLYPTMMFVTQKMYGNPSEYGILGRSEDNGETMTITNDELFSAYVNDQQSIGMVTDSAYYSDVTPIRLWESFYDTNSIQLVKYKAARVLQLGDTVDITSACKRVFKHIITTSDLNGYTEILKDSIFYVKDTYQSMLAIGLKNSVWLTREGLDMSKVPPTWYRIAKTSSTVKKIISVEFSKDGNYLYFSDYDKALDSSIVYRCSNLVNGRDSVTGDANSSGNVIQTQIIGSFAHKVTGIAVDPSNANNVLLTVGGYNSTIGVYYSNVAATTTSVLAADNFISKHSTSLPNIPIYCGLINYNNSAQVFIGTEYGVYSTENIADANPVWVEQNATGTKQLAHVPVLQLRQQIHPNGLINVPGAFGDWINTEVTNQGMIYAATFGRGIFSCDDFKGPVSVPQVNSDNSLISQVVVYPNPVKDVANVLFNLDNNGDVKFRIYDLKGNVVKSMNLNNLVKGEQSMSFSTSDLTSGTYIIEMEKNKTRSSSKFIIN